MRLRKIPGAREFVTNHESVLSAEQAFAHAGKWRELLSRPEGDLCLEVGMGRGRFITESVKTYPDRAFVGLELREEMIMQTIEKLESTPDNLRFLHANANLLTEMFAPGEVSVLYLNFPDPWPKSRHAKRRLTAIDFLQKYRQILAADGILRFKTDNLDLFEWSLDNFKAAGFNIMDVDRALSREKAGVITEYENRYRRRGQPIYFTCMKNS